MARSKKPALAHPEASSNGAATAVDEPPARPPDSKFDWVDPNRVRESATNPRRTFEDGALGELAESIRVHGILQPLLIRPTDSGLELVAGARRLRAAKLVGMRTVPVIVQELDDRAALEVQYLENLQREDLHPLEEANGYAQLHDGHGYSIEQLAAKLGKSKSYVYGRLQLSKLPQKAQKLFLDGKLDASTALLLARIPVPALAEKAAADVTRQTEWNGPMSYREAAAHIREQYQCHLKGAGFDPKDAGLVPAAGPCTTCPKRTGNQKDLFGPVAGEDRADDCTDPKCFATKEAAQRKRTKAEVLGRGGQVLKDAQASKARYSAEYVKPDEHVIDDAKHRTWRQLCKGQDLVEILLEHSDGETEIRWRKKDVLAAVKENGHKLGRARTAEASYPRDALRRKKLRQRQAAVEAVLPRFRENAKILASSDVLRLIIELELGRGQAAGVVGKRRGIDLRMEWKRDERRWPEPTAKAIGAMELPELQSLALELLAGERPAGAAFTDGYYPDWERLCDVLSIDLKAAEKTAALAAPAKKGKKPTAAAILSERKRGKAKKGKKAAAGDDDDEAKCRVCGCTEDSACEGGCHWVVDDGMGDLCSACAEKIDDPGESEDADA
jgi:ParB/RepB/Spo0J family partition protein